jgi:hypothetical protein
MSGVLWQEIAIKGKNILAKFEAKPRGICIALKINALRY